MTSLARRRISETLHNKSSLLSKSVWLNIWWTFKLSNQAWLSIIIVVPDQAINRHKPNSGNDTYPDFHPDTSLLSAFCFHETSSM